MEMEKTETAHEILKREYKSYPCNNCQYHKEDTDNCAGCYYWKQWCDKKLREFRIALGKEVEEDE